MEILLATGGSFQSSETSYNIGGCQSPSSSCAANEQEFFISITTDNWPGETSWQLVDQNGGGWYINPGDLTQSNTTYTWSICVPDTNCYTFTIFDSYGDGICCDFGNGSYFVNYGGSQIASGGSFLSSKLLHQLVPVLFNCVIGETEIVITINTDDYSNRNFLVFNGSIWWRMDKCAFNNF